MKELVIYIDGAAKGNPGPAACGVVIYERGHILRKLSQFIGETTNNVAEYNGLIYALKEALLLNASCLRIYTDSELLYRQINGEYKVRHINIKPLYTEARHLFGGFDSVDVSYISRNKNQLADKLATQAIRESQKRQASKRLPEQ